MPSALPNKTLAVGLGKLNRARRAAPRHCKRNVWLLGIFFSGGALGGAGDWRNRWGRKGVYGIGLQKIF